MKYFDALYASVVVGPFSQGYYDIRTFRATSQRGALARARAHARKVNADFERTGLQTRLIGVAPAGEYDAFVGKYLGQFIDEAFPPCN